MFELVISASIVIIAWIILLIYAPLSTMFFTLLFIFGIIVLKWFIDQINLNPTPKKSYFEDAIPPDCEYDDSDDDFYDSCDDDTPTKRGPGRPRKGS